MNEMIIENAEYIFDTFYNMNSGIKATIDGVEMSVPLDEANRHYAAILAAVEAGTLTIADADS